jgi:hypothetical protein
VRREAGNRFPRKLPKELSFSSFQYCFALTSHRYSPSSTNRTSPSRSLAFSQDRISSIFPRTKLARRGLSLAAVANTYVAALAHIDSWVFNAGRLGLTAILFLIGSGISVSTVKSVGVAAKVARRCVMDAGGDDDAISDSYADYFVLRGSAVRSSVMNESCVEIAAANG